MHISTLSAGIMVSLALGVGLTSVVLDEDSGTAVAAKDGAKNVEMMDAGLSSVRNPDLKDTMNGEIVMPSMDEMYGDAHEHGHEHGHDHEHDDMGHETDMVAAPVEKQDESQAPVVVAAVAVLLL